MDIGICSFSFHRLFAAGKQDIFQFITDCKALGCTQLDPWNAQLTTLKSGDAVLHAGHNPDKSQYLSAADDDYIASVKAAADKAALPFGCIAVDGAHIYEADVEKRQANRLRAYRWLAVAHKLGAKQIRVDAGGSEDLPDDVLAVIKEGYADLITRGRPLGVEILVENHWGASIIPDKMVKILESCPGLGMLWDSHNWKPQDRSEGRRKTLKFARCTHIKTFAFDAGGNEITPGEDTAGAIAMVKASGYKGTWGIESVPTDGDEIQGARQTIALIKRLAS